MRALVDQVLADQRHQLASPTPHRDQVSLVESADADADKPKAAFTCAGVRLWPW